MGTTARIVAGDASDDALAWALDELERLEQCYSRFRPDSELCRLNRRTGESVPVSPRMLLALTCAVDLHRATGGRFDPTIIDALERAGYDRTFEDVDPAAATAAPPSVPAPGLESVQVDTEQSSVRLAPGTRIDLGGVGKGLAADLLARGLVDRGARSALVGLGGDLRARGEWPEGGWTIPVEDPFAAGRTRFQVRLTDGAVVTSSARIRTWERAGRRLHHLIDPATGAPAMRGVGAVVVSARDAWWAEGVAKAIVVAGVDAGARIARDTNVEAWAFLDDSSMIGMGVAA